VVHRLIRAFALGTAVIGAFVPQNGDATAPRPLTIFVEEDPSSLNTILNTAYGWQLGPLTQGYLFTVDDRGALVPDLAVRLPTRANGGISADGRTIAYELRRARWSDGVAFDARDVAFTIDALRNPNTNVPDRSVVAPIVRVETPRPDRLVVHLREPYAPFVSSFLTLGASDPFAILPRHVAARYANLNASSLDLHPIGLGPFRLARWSRGDRLVFERNPYYWRGAAGVARVDVLVEPNAQTRLFSARTGALDATYVSGLEVRSARDAHLRVVRTTSNIVDYLQFNERKSPFADARARRAVALAINRARLAATIYHGLEVPTDSGSLDPAISRDAHLPAFDPAAARRTLPAPLHVELAFAGAWRSSSTAAVQIAAQLHAVGIDVELHSYQPGTFWGPKSGGGVLENGRFDLALTSWSPSLDPDRSYLFDCSAVPPGGGNAGGYCDRAFDAAQASGARSNDPATRTAAYRRAHAILARDLPILPIGFERSAYAVSARFKNFKPNLLGRDYWNAWEWRVDE
jgi:peptide/nickel transport system substrate-binding protein